MRHNWNKDYVNLGKVDVKREALVEIVLVHIKPQNKNFLSLTVEFCFTTIVILLKTSYFLYLRVTF